MVTLGSSAKVTISDSKPDSPAAFPFFNLLFESLTMSLPAKLDAPLAVSFWGKLFLRNLNSTFKSFSR